MSGSERSPGSAGWHGWARTGRHRTGSEDWVRRSIIWRISTFREV